VQKGGEINTLYRWDVKSDKLNEVGKMSTLASTIGLYSGLTMKEIEADVSDKAKVMAWMTKKKYREVNSVGNIVSHYYMNPDEVLEAAAKGTNWVFES
jgi:hypothetical protein